MTDKEKLTSLIVENLNLTPDIARVVGIGRVKKIADYLIVNGVTFATDTNDGRKHGRWIIHSSGRGEYANNWAECSECHVCGSPCWKVCPVCEAKMED